MRHASTAVKAAALLLATPAFLFPMQAAAQQMGVGGPKPGTTMQDCERMSDLAARTACTCTLVVGNRVNIEATQRANNEGLCADKIKSGIADGKFTREALGAVLAGRPAREVGACNILAVLAKLRIPVKADTVYVSRRTALR